MRCFMNAPPLFKMVRHRVGDVGFVVHARVVGVIIELQLRVYACAEVRVKVMPLEVVP